MFLIYSGRLSCQCKHTEYRFPRRMMPMVLGGSVSTERYICIDSWPDFAAMSR